MIKIIIITLILLITIFPMLLYLVADHFKLLQKHYCKIGWHCHMKDYEQISFDGVSMHCKCKWCGYEGMVDSQGNLF